MATMRAVDVRGGKGDHTALFINHETPRPTPAQGQVLVKIRAFGINRMDLSQREGRYALPPQAPRTMGVEFSGVVAALGPAGEDTAGRTFDVGDEVLGLAYGGAYAEYIAVGAGMLLRKPGFLSFEQCAALPENWMTAVQALHSVLRFQPGSSILWHAGASGVASAGIQLSRDAGASAVYATAGSAEKIGLITSKLGATEAFNYKTQDWRDEVLAATGGKGVDCIVDFVGADYFNKNVDAAARDGSIVILGLMSGAVAQDANIGKVMYKRLRIQGSTLRSRDEAYQAALLAKLEEYLPDFEAGKLKIYIDTVLPWEKIQEAHKHMEDAKNFGKIVCTIS